jgi:DNA-directed RNA polymerase subunit RPC12/RpoP
MNFLVIQCVKCGKLFLCMKKQKTKRCPYCNALVKVFQAKKIGEAETAREAKEIISKSKEAFFKMKT